MYKGASRIPDSRVYVAAALRASKVGVSNMCGLV